MYSTLSLIHLRVNNVSKEFSSAVIYKVRYMLIVLSSKLSHSQVFTCEVGILERQPQVGLYTYPKHLHTFSRSILYDR